MSRNQKLSIEIKQTKTILEDFTKLRKQCQNLSYQLEQQFGKQKFYQELQRQINLKVNILDHAGLVALKNRLVVAVDELMELANELNYKIQRRNTRRQIFKNQKDQIGYFQPKKNQEKVVQDSKTAQAKKQKIRQQTQLPFYVIRNDTVENKLDSISKFIASLKRSMKLQVQTDPVKIRQMILFMEPEYLKIRQRLQRYKMRQEQLAILFQKKVQQEVQKYIKNSEVLQENQFYSVIKVHKKAPKKLLSPKKNRSDGEEQKQISKEEQKNNKILDILEIDKNNLKNGDIINLNEIRKRVNEDFNLVKNSIENTTKNNLQGIFQKINQTVQFNQSRLKQLRVKRKKMFIDDDIWEEMEQI